MGQSRRRARLAHESVPQLVVGGKVRRQELYGYRPVEPHVSGEIHHGHPAPTELALECVMARQCLLKREEEWVDSGGRCGVAHAMISRSPRDAAGA
jgi:hypothetical protein